MKKKLLCAIAGMLSLLVIFGVLCAYGPEDPPTISSNPTHYDTLA